MNKLRRLRAVMGLTTAAMIATATALVSAATLVAMLVVPVLVFADHNSLHTTPCNEPDTVGGGDFGNSPGSVGPPDSLGFDVGSGQCNGSFTITRDPGFPSPDGDGIELGLRIEQRSVGQVQRIGGNDYQVELGNDTTQPNVNRAWWNFQHSIAYDGDINDLDSLTFTIHTDAGPNLPAAPSFDMLGVVAPDVTLRDLIDDRNNQPNPTTTFSDLYQTSQNPEFGWFTVDPDTTAPVDGDFDYSKEGAWRMTLTAEKDGQTAGVSICVHTPNARCLPDHFQCYEVKEVTKLDPSPGPANLEDQFGVVEAKVKKAKIICAPVDKNGEGILNPEAHLVCYKLEKGLKPKQEVTIENQFGNQVLRVDKARLLCVPSTKEVLGDTVGDGDDDGKDKENDD